MIATIHVKDKQYRHYSNKNVSIHKLLEIIRLLENAASENHQIVDVAINIRENPDDDTFVYNNDQFQVGNGNGYEVFDTIRRELLVLFPDRQEDIVELIVRLTEAVSLEQGTAKVPKKRVEEKQDSFEENNHSEIVLEEMVETSDNVLAKEETTPDTTVISTSAITPTEYETVSPTTKPFAKMAKSRIRKRTVLMGCLGVLGVVIIGCGAIWVGSSWSSWFKPSYETLMQQENYVTAVREYPLKKEAIETALFDKAHEGIPALEEYVNATNSQTATFDLAYLKQDYETVVDLKEYANSPIRKTELAVAYVKTGAVDEAYQLNEQLKSEKLGELIQQSYTQQAIELLKQLKIEEAEQIQQKLHSLSVQTKLDTVKAFVNSRNDLKKQLEDTSITPEKKEQLTKQLQEVESKLAQVQKGVF